MKKKIIILIEDEAVGGRSYAGDYVRVWVSMVEERTEENEGFDDAEVTTRTTSSSSSSW